MRTLLVVGWLMVPVGVGIWDYLGRARSTCSLTAWPRSWREAEQDAAAGDGRGPLRNMTRRSSRCPPSALRKTAEFASCGRGGDDGRLASHGQRRPAGDARRRAERAIPRPTAETPTEGRGLSWQTRSII